VKRYLTGLLLICLTSALFSQESAIKKSQVIETYKGKQYYIHFVDQGQSISSISRAYGVSIDELKLANPDIGEVLQVDKMLMIPVSSEDIQAKPAISVKPEKPTDAPAITVKLSKPDTSRVTQHIVAPKETWYALSRLYNVPVKNIIEANPGVDTLRIGQTVVIPSYVLQPAGLPVRPGFVTHVVAPQETLYGISNRYKISVDELVNINPELKNGLKSGQVIYVPDRKTNGASGSETIKHVVKRKETLYSISKLYKIDISDILRANPDMHGNLRKNDVILIPVKKKGTPVQMNEKEVFPDHDLNLEATEPVFPKKSICVNRPHDQVFNIALLIPFQLSYSESILTTEVSSLKLPSDYPSLDFIQFYEGVLIAADDAESRGVRAKIHVYDTDAGSGTMKTQRLISNNSLKNMDLIIGPLFANGFELMSEYAKEHKIPVVNPLSQRNEILEANPFVIKIQPSGWSYYNSICRDMAAAFPGANFTVMRMNDTENRSMADVFISELKKAASSPDLVHDVNYSVQHASGLIGTLHPNKTNVILLLTSGKALIPSLLSQLNDVRNSYNIAVVGMSDWKDLEIDFSYLHNLNAHFFAPWFVDYSDGSVIDYIQEFRRRYQGEPEPERYGYLGYDVTRYFLEALYLYGPDFMDCLPEIKNPMLSRDFRFYQSPGGGFDNTGVRLYRLNNYKFEPLK